MSQLPSVIRINEQITELLHDLSALSSKYVNDVDEVPESCIQAYLDEHRRILDRVVELQGIRDTAQKSAMVQIVKNDYTFHYYAKNTDVVRDGRLSLSMGKYVMLTVNPRPDVKPVQLVGAVKGFMSTAAIKYGCYVFEQRGQVAGDYQGFHAHMFFKRRDKPCVVMKQVKSSFAGLVGDVTNYHHVNVKSGNTRDEFRTYYTKYMLGDKADASKLLSVHNNARMRAAYSLDEVYFVSYKGVRNPLVAPPVQSESGCVGVKGESRSLGESGPGCESDSD